MVGGDVKKSSSSLSPPHHHPTVAVIGSQALVDPHNADFPSFRKIVLKCIMGTEVASHAQHVEAIKRLLVEPLRNKQQQHADENAANNPCVGSLLCELLVHDDAAREALMVALVEAADISNEIRSFEHFSRKWAPLVVEEFCRQGDIMQQLHWDNDVPPLFRRGVAHPAKDQPGFIQHLCLPLYRTLAAVMPSTFQRCVVALESNAATWSSGRW
jgi:hypothetical protein